MRGSATLRLAVFACVCACFAPASAHASGFLTGRFAAEHGHPVNDNATAVFYNPATLVWGAQTSVFLEGTLAIRNMTYNRDRSDKPEPEGVEGGNTGESKLNNVFVAPSLAASYRLGDWAFGAGVFVPFGGALSWSTNKDFKNSKAPGPLDGSQRWHALEGTFTAIYMSGAAAYSFGDTGLSLGLVGNLIRLDTDITQAMTASFDDNIAAEGRLYVKTAAWTGSFGLGLAWEVAPELLWLGLSYQAPPGLWSDVSAAGEMTTNFPTGTNTDDVHFDQRFPDQLRAGMRVRPRPDWEIRLFGEYIRWSALEGQCLGRSGDTCARDSDGLVLPSEGFANFVRNWNNAVGVRAGVSYFVMPTLETFAGVGYDSTAVPDATLDPGLYDGHDLSFSLGARSAVTKNLWVNASYTHMHTLQRDNRGRSTLADPPSPNRVPSSNATYEQWIGMANLNLELRFGQPSP